VDFSRPTDTEQMSSHTPHQNDGKVAIFEVFQNGRHGHLRKLVQVTVSCGSWDWSGCPQMKR